MEEHRILLAGTPDIAVPLLKALCERFNVVGVLTSSDKRVGRSDKLVPSPVKAAALDLGLPVLQFDTIRSEARNAVAQLGADTLISFAFGRIFGPLFLGMFPKGRFNVHPSALPQLRGPSPVQFTIDQNFKFAAISLQDIGLAMDEGDIWGVHSFPLDGTETNQTLTDRVATEVATFVPPLLEKIFEGTVKPVPQMGEATYCTMIDRQFGQLDFNNPVEVLHARIRSCYPWPKAWAHVNGTDIAITGVWGGFSYVENPDCPETIEPGKVVAFRKDRGIGVCCQDGILWITALQLPAKKELDFKSFVNGNRWILESRFE